MRISDWSSDVCSSDLRATLKEQGDNLPRIPPGRLGARYQWTHGPASADLEYYRTFAQNRVASYETRTEGYDMLNATMSYRLDVGSGQSVEFYARATNQIGRASCRERGCQSVEL